MNDCGNTRGCIDRTHQGEDQGDPARGEERRPALEEAQVDDPAERCLARLLRTFFPAHVGASARHQARGYIRTSAIGRGAYPPGSPDARGMIAALESVGFSRRVHRGHLQAPWGRRGGASAVPLRNELSAFLRDGTKGPAVRSLIGRLRDQGRWSGDPDVGEARR